MAASITNATPRSLILPPLIGRRSLILALHSIKGRLKRRKWNHICIPIGKRIGWIRITLWVRYAEYLSTVLKNITFTIPGKKKVGVVGRTGSGKSTLIQVLFRIVEPREGSIIIEGVDICKIGLHDLRSRLSIIPQDPTLFDGTVRGNLDPFNEYSDDRIWQVHIQTFLHAVVENTSLGSI